MKDDTGAAGGPGGPGCPGMGGLNGFHEDSAAASQAEFMAQVGAWPRPRSSQRQGQGQGVAPCHQAVPSGQGQENQVPGRDLALLPAHLGI